MLYIYPYKTTSESARALREGLSSSLNYRVKLVKPDGRFKPKRSDLIINWGSSRIPLWQWGWGRDLNNTTSVESAANKLVAFGRFKHNEITTPRWTTDREEAQQWCNSGSTIVVRNLLNGHSGQGIDIVTGDILPNAPLYVEYKKKRHEFRVHVFKGEVIDTQQKKKRQEANRPDTFNTFVRNAANGWVYCRNDIIPDVHRDALAILAVRALDLDFGAVDIIYNERENQNYVLEVNSAPGLEGTTLQKYIDTFLTLV